MKITEGGGYVFQSTLSMRRATAVGNVSDFGEALFQSTLSMRRATCMLWKAQYASIFQSTLSMRRATTYEVSCPNEDAYFNPRSP